MKMETVMAILSDYHMHTHHSGDSEAPMEDMIKRSIELGLSEICFTDHLDLDYPECFDLPEDPFNLDVSSYRSEYQKYKELYKDKITIRFGVEVGMQTQVASDNLSFVKENDLDFVIASIHLVGKKDPFYPDFWQGDSVENIFKKTFDATLENIKLFDDYDVLGHLDYISRYVPEGDTTYSYERFKDQIDDILRYLISHDKGLDFNSKVLSKDLYADPNPCPAALLRFRELGGRIITFGSDAHKPETIACGFDRMRQIALESGFTEYFTFEKRNPIPHML